MKYLNRESILAKKDIVTENVDVPEWGGTVRVRTLAGYERDEFDASMMANRDEETEKVNVRGMKVKLVSMSVVDDKGQRMFPDSDIEELNKKSSGALNRIFEVASRLSGLGEADVKELAKNSKGDRKENSGSGSPKD